MASGSSQGVWEHQKPEAEQPGFSDQGHMAEVAQKGYCGSHCCSHSQGVGVTGRERIWSWGQLIMTRNLLLLLFAQWLPSFQPLTRFSLVWGTWLQRALYPSLLSSTTREERTTYLDSHSSSDWLSFGSLPILGPSAQA